MISLIKRLIDRLRPPCPSGLPHRMRGGSFVNRRGETYCWHPDCQAEAAAAMPGCPHSSFEPLDSCRDIVYEACRHCGAHRIRRRLLLIDDDFT